MPFPPDSKPRDRMRWFAMRILARNTSTVEDWLRQTGQNLDHNEMEIEAANDILDLMDYLEEKEKKNVVNFHRSRP